MALPLTSLFTLEDSVLIFQLLNYQLTHLPNSRLHQSCLDRKREQNSRNRWHNGYGNYQFPDPPLFVSKNLQKTNISARSLPVATSCESLSPSRAPQLFHWNHADRGDVVMEHAF